LDDLKLAINNKQAINCVVNYSKDNYQYQIQANKNWDAVKVTVLVEEDDAYQQKVLSIKGDSVYMWSQDDSSDAGKWPFEDSYYAELVDKILSGDYDDDITLSCQTADDRDLVVPVNINFDDLTNDHGEDNFGDDVDSLELDDY
jgi:hypothetical protein